MQVKDKLINHLMINGNKKTSEKILIKSFKKLQKDTQKRSSKLLQLALINSTPIFKLHVHKIKKKRKKKTKEIPVFISNINYRTSSAIKLIMSNKNKKSNKFFNELKEEIFLASQKKGLGLETKASTQKQIVVLKKKLFSFKWKKKQKNYI